MNSVEAEATTWIGIDERRLSEVVPAASRATDPKRSRPLTPRAADIGLGRLQSRNDVLRAACLS